MITQYKGIRPRIGKRVYIAPGAYVIGNVEIGDEASIWFNCVVRGDFDSITIGRRSNIQDLSVLHPDIGHPVIIGEDVTVGHSCVLHGCKIGNASLIGMGAVILNDAVIGENSLVGAGSLVPERKVFPPNSLILGTPAKVVRELTPEEISSILNSAQEYWKIAQEYLDK
ncbi:MAG: gamma carbonic anhydrase family protein [Desulfitobacteriia bacterium]|jgi:carbonic anhydrase/acetyltransferase-like protein (isoleucine patch superfamily)